MATTLRTRAIDIAPPIRRRFRVAARTGLRSPLTASMFWGCGNGATLAFPAPSWCRQTPCVPTSGCIGHRRPIAPAYPRVITSLRRSPLKATLLAAVDRVLRFAIWRCRPRPTYCRCLGVRDWDGAISPCHCFPHGVGRRNRAHAVPSTGPGSVIDPCVLPPPPPPPKAGPDGIQASDRYPPRARASIRLRTHPSRLV